MVVCKHNKTILGQQFLVNTFRMYLTLKNIIGDFCHESQRANSKTFVFLFKREEHDH